MLNWIARVARGAARGARQAFRESTVRATGRVGFLGGALDVVTDVAGGVVEGVGRGIGIIDDSGGSSSSNQPDAVQAIEALAQRITQPVGTGVQRSAQRATAAGRGAVAGAQGGVRAQQSMQGGFFATVKQNPMISAAGVALVLFAVWMIAGQ